MTREEAAYCDRNICLRNEYNGIGCDECEVTKSQEPNTVIATGDGAYYHIKALLQDPSSDLISRQVIKSEYKRKLKETLIDMDRNIDLTEYADCSSFNEFIDSIPSIKPQPCDDAISREAALEKMADYVASGYADSAEDFEEYSRIICQLPPVKPQEKTGHWILKIEDWNKWICSECGYTERTDIHVSLGYDFCPKCGAKMFEPQEGANE